MHLKEKLEKRQARIGVIGLGYVGLPLAVEFAEAGFDVTVVGEGCRAVNLQPQDGAAAIDVMTAAGATLLR